MAPPSAATTEALAAVLARFGIAKPTVRDIRTGWVNRHWRIDTAGASYVLRRYERARSAAAIRYEHDVLLHLVGKGWPVAVPVAARAGETVAEAEGRSYALFPLLPGRPAPYVGARQARLKGRLLARLHQDMASWEAPGQRDGFGRLWELDVFVATWSDAASFNELLMAFGQEHPELARAVRAQKYAVLRELSTLGYGELPPTLCHFDFHRDNLLFQRGELTGLLDFDFIRLDARVADIATCIASDCRAPPAYNEIDVAAVRAFVGGYTEHTRLNDAEVQLIVPLCRAYVLWLVALTLTRWAAGARDTALRSIQRSVGMRFPGYLQQRPELEAAVLQAASERGDRA